jgi:hypothetical protein
LELAITDQWQAGEQTIRAMQSLSQEIAGTDFAAINTDASIGTLAWSWGKDHSTLAPTWRQRLWRDGADIVGWGWILLPYTVALNTGGEWACAESSLVWQVRPGYGDVLDDVLAWYDELADGMPRYTTVRAGDSPAIARLADHRFRHDTEAPWLQLHGRSIGDVPDTGLAAGFTFRTAKDVGVAAAVTAQHAVSSPSSFALDSARGVRDMWPYREDLHLFVESPGGDLVAHAIVWLDERNRVAELEPLGASEAHPELELALVRFAMTQAAAAGATHMYLTMHGDGEPAQRDSYQAAGFAEVARDLPHVKS